MPHVLVLVVALVVVFAAPPGAAAPCAGFTDVEDTSPFCPNVSWLRNRNITFGCTATLYCPNDPVSRLQMAAFMNRLGDALFPLSCAADQVMKWDGVQWGCANDNIGGSGGGGTVTSVAAGTGLQATPNPITGAGAINLAPSYQLPQACTNGQVAKSNGSGSWTCAADSAGGSGTVTSLTAGTGVALTPNPITTTGTIAVNTTAIQQRVTGSCAVGSYIRAIAADGTVTCQADTTGPANAFVLGGNAFGATAILGTNDAQALSLWAGGNRVMRYEPNAISPNVIGGSPVNSVTTGVRGATIGGGGAALGADPDFVSEAPNRVTDVYGTVGGGQGNIAGDDAGTTIDNPFATVGGGGNNTASGSYSTVGGGISNTASGLISTVGGGFSNNASGLRGMVGGGSSNTASNFYSTVGGGNNNTASGSASTVAGGEGNTASGPQRSTVGGGSVNTASGLASTVVGGTLNVAGGDYSVAMGRRAKALGDGSFAFADSNDFDFSSGTANAFRVRATGGVRFVVEIDGSGGILTSCLLNSTTVSWSCSSDRNLKQDLVELDGEAVLAKLVALPVYQWQPKGANAHVKHYGPMAQDFHAAFGLGDDDKMIGMQDADGVALAAIKGLNAKLAEAVGKRDARIDALEREIDRLRAIVEALAAHHLEAIPEPASRALRGTGAH